MGRYSSLQLLGVMAVMGGVLWFLVSIAGGQAEPVRQVEPLPAVYTLPTLMPTVPIAVPAPPAAPPAAPLVANYGDGNTTTITNNTTNTNVCIAVVGCW